jgi:hypothetical protein
MTSDLTLGEIGRTVVRVEAKVDHALNDHESRLRRLEGWMYALPISMVVAAVSTAVAILK